MVYRPRRYRRANCTPPFSHRGRFFNTEVALHHYLYVVYPSGCALRPRHVLVFELFCLAPAYREPHYSSRRTYQHQALAGHDIAWGVKPLTTPEAQCLCDQFKTLLL